MAEAGDYGALVEAIVDALRADTGAGSLVALTNHDTKKESGYRIYRAESTVKPRLPSICVDLVSSTPVTEDATYFQRSLVTLDVFSNGRPLGMSIANRILQKKPTLTFSADTINIKRFNYLETSFSGYRDNEDYYQIKLDFEFFWVGNPCS